MPLRLQPPDSPQPLLLLPASERKGVPSVFKCQDPELLAGMALADGERMRLAGLAD